MHKKIILGLVVATVVFITGCYPDSSRSLENTELVYTNYDEGFDFSANRSYYLNPEVISIDTTETIDPQIQAYIRSAIRREMAAKNYTETTAVDDNGFPTENPGIVIFATATTVTTTGVSYWPGYGGWWGGYWGWGGWPGYGWGSVAIPYQYDSGLLTIDHIDWASRDTINESADAVWISTITGILSSSGISQSRIDRVVSQAYEQSPYM